MAHGITLDMNAVPGRTREWVVKHEVHDRTRRGKTYPVPANRAERRAAERGKPWYGNPLPSRMIVHEHPVNPAGGNA